MNDYNFWADLLDTFQSSPDWIKALWLLALSLVAIMMRFRIDDKKLDMTRDGELLYSVRRNHKDQWHITAHAPQIGNQPPLLLLAPPNDEPHAAQDGNGRT